MAKKDFEFMKYRRDIMEEYDFSYTNYMNQFLELSKLNEDLMNNHPNKDVFNLDNQPSHRIKDE